MDEKQCKINSYDLLKRFAWAMGKANQNPLQKTNAILKKVALGKSLVLKNAISDQLFSLTNCG